MVEPYLVFVGLFQHSHIPQPEHPPCCLWRFEQLEAGIHLKEGQDLEKAEKGVGRKDGGVGGWSSHCILGTVS